MAKTLYSIIPQKINRSQAKDTGMAMVLICLLLGVVWDKGGVLVLAIPLLVINMIVPGVFKPVAKIWLGLSTLLGTIMSRVILSILFLVIVTPVGLVRRWLGADSLQLKTWKKGQKSVFSIRDHKFESKEMENPY
ncbi:MAG: SxtJ family membrane protein [Candidatus Latescibacterota bacterium]